MEFLYNSSFLIFNSITGNSSNCNSNNKIDYSEKEKNDSNYADLIDDDFKRIHNRLSRCKQCSTINKSSRVDQYKERSLRRMYKIHFECKSCGTNTYINISNP